MESFGNLIIGVVQTHLHVKKLSATLTCDVTKLMCPLSLNS